MYMSAFFDPRGLPMLPLQQMTGEFTKLFNPLAAKPG
jgi:hypothetical protein